MLLYITLDMLIITFSSKEEYALGTTINLINYTK